METEFTKTKFAELTDLTPRRVLDWTTREYIKPHKPAGGQGKRSRYNLANAIQAKVLEKLSEKGITLSKFSTIFHGSTIETQLRGLADYYLATLRDDFDFKEMIFSLIVIGDCRSVRVEQTETHDELHLKMRDGDDLPTIDDFWETALVINLNRILWELKRKLTDG